MQLPFSPSPPSWRGLRWLRLPAWRVPGAFAEPEMESAWLHQTAMHRRWLDGHAFAFSALIHLLEFARAAAAGNDLFGETSSSSCVVVGRLLYCALLLLLLPALARRAPGWYVPRREAVIAVVRLGAACAAPLWVGPPAPPAGRSGGDCHRAQRADAFDAVITGGWLGRLPLLALPVRWPLQAAVSAASFAFVLPQGVTGAARARGWATALNAAVVFAFERSSRAHFAAARAAADAKAGKLD